MSVLIVEDDDRLMDALRAYLRKSGYATTGASDAAQAMESLGADTEVVLLDLGLPDMDGIELCRLIRQRSGVPIIIATARSHVQERIRGLRAGADDFVVKPYNVLELVARIEAVTRRWRTAVAEPDHDQVITLSGLRIDLASRQLAIDGESVDLTRTEFDIVAALARYPGVVVPRERIIREVWQTDWHAYSRSLEVHVGSIRRKTGRVDVIETVRGVGYRVVGS
ncbi:DNA-binding response OmpR family regulator [Microcella putealis]|uniref:Sensory transduction protein RegX3 n=1 Tax=Microcella putealis TaxID=337005 RepID=A0A4Q7LTU5_9MICO|nr:response regulator transcription factor [Microcella putealis]RZS57672.1 DNA-binding response OmpR family regulator [Microcella putealis]TQM24739.1 DNA-binding response OmpR family regulator [Microcella putealis]